MRNDKKRVTQQKIRQIMAITVLVVLCIEICKFVTCSAESFGYHC